MTISRREFLSAALATGTAALPNAAFARKFAPFADDADRNVFKHGVASGDPRKERVILWTRVSPLKPINSPIEVQWAIAWDPSFRHVVNRGRTETHAGRDFTVKVDADDLEPGTTYYYRFQVRGAKSPIGRTRTLPTGHVDRLRFAVASCSNYPFGYFNAYGLIADRADLDAVLHLGDYLYEYENGAFGDGTPFGRLPVPAKEIVALEDYRQRHAIYRTDPDLQEVHRQNPFITVWDDHESANDAWKDGAENHDPLTEGSWDARKRAAIRAYFEWMPIRERNDSEGGIYRRFRFGQLAELTMLDTRLIGRDKQAASPADVATINDPIRQLLGAPQEQWLFGRLSDSYRDGIRWRVIGQQIMMAQLSLDFGRSIANPDQWDGYRPARDRLYSHLRNNRIDNVVVLTGDIHSSWGNDLTPNPFDGSYNPGNGAGSLGVEFVTPGITSPFLFPDTPAGAAQAAATAVQLKAISPHIKSAELFRRGYLLLDIDQHRAQGEWYYPQTIKQITAAQDTGEVFYSVAGSNYLIPASGPSVPRANAADLAP